MAFGKTKIKACDTWFSKVVREAADNTCVRCGKTSAQGQLHCSHIMPRDHRTVRWAKENAKCLCARCHDLWHANPVEAGAWARHHFGEEHLDRLMEKRQVRVRVPKAEEKQIAAHYRAEHQRLLERRADGEIGPLDYISYQ